MDTHLRHFPKLDGIQQESEPFPLSRLLILYENASHFDVYPQYFEGFKLLCSYLSPIDTECLTGISDSYLLNKFQRNYELQEIARILNVDQCKLLQYYNQVMEVRRREG